MHFVDADSDGVGDRSVAAFAVVTEGTVVSSSTPPTSVNARDPSVKRKFWYAMPYVFHSSTEVIVYA